MTDKKLLSIVIPSRNRQKYAIHCIKSILDIKDNRIEVVVHDNSDTNELEQLIIEQINDERLIYNYDPTPMSTVHNFNKAMEYVNGEYLCFIGDDDGVNPEIIKVVDWAKKNKLDAIVEKLGVRYDWPSEKHDGILSIYPFSKKKEIVNVQSELKKFLKRNGVNYLNYKIPRIYHGIVSKRSFDIVKETIGYYFGGLSVDIFSSISLSLVTQSVVIIDYPFTIAGSSPASDKTHNSKEARKIKLEEAPHFREIGEYRWSKLVPEVYSGASVLAESGIKALEAFKRMDLLGLINKYNLSAIISLRDPQHEKAIMSFYLRADTHFGVRIIHKMTKTRIITLTLIKKIGNRIRNCFIYQKDRKIYGVENIEIATKLVVKNIGNLEIKQNYIS